MQRLVQKINPSRTYGPKNDGLVFHKFNLGSILIVDGLLKSPFSAFQHSHDK
ncbi:hypothetical protein M9458_009975, partial [Cirrhinus mrigala]